MDLEFDSTEAATGDFSADRIIHGLATRFVGHYNTKWLHSAIGYVTPRDKMLGICSRRLPQS
jgi:hypothetical protein